MPLIAKDKGGGDFDPLSVGMHHAVCYGVVDLGTQPGGQFRPKREIAILWEIQAERIEIEKDGAKKSLPRAISATFTLSLSPKSRLRPMLESWRGRPFTEEELNGFDLKKILSANALLNVIHKAGSGTNAGKTFARVQAVNPLVKGTPPQKNETPAIYFSIDDCGDRIIIPEAVPDWMKKKIHDSDEWIRDQQRSGMAPLPPEEGKESAPGGHNEEEEDVPF